MTCESKFVNEIPSLIDIDLSSFNLNHNPLGGAVLI